MYNFIHNSVKQINTHMVTNLKSTYETIRLCEVVKQFNKFSDRLSSRYRDIGEKCIEKGWYYR